jgi:uncharacterized protein (TIGR00251 family)
MVIEVKVKPGAGKDAVLNYKAPNFFEISVKAKAEKNQANQALCKFLGKLFGIGSSNVKILKGKTSRNKLIKLETLSESEFLKRVERLKK